METGDLVRLHLEGGVGEVVLNRPEKRNALNDAMVAQLADRIDRAEAAGVRALVLRGEGKGFSAGRDLAEADPANDDPYAILSKVLNPLLARIAGFPAPTFAAVQGPCLGLGLGLAFACDVVYAAHDARIGSPFGAIGAVLDSGGHHYFVDRLGAHRALELIYTGRLLSGEQAEAWGLVNRSVEADELLDVVRALARKVAAGPTRALLISKQIVRGIVDSSWGFPEVLEAEAKAQAEASRTHDYQE
ncbi:MAG: enoyl-CoA hydratase/isomerase family protein, partial [Acidimicrobiia bacterium]